MAVHAANLKSLMLATQRAFTQPLHFTARSSIPFAVADFVSACLYLLYVLKIVLC